MHGKCFTPEEVEEAVNLFFPSGVPEPPCAVASPQQAGAALKKRTKEVPPAAPRAPGLPETTGCRPGPVEPAPAPQFAAPGPPKQAPAQSSLPPPCFPGLEPHPQKGSASESLVPPAGELGPPAVDEKLELRVKGTGTHVRAHPPRLRAAASAIMLPLVCPSAEDVQEPPQKCAKVAATSSAEAAATARDAEQLASVKTLRVAEDPRLLGPFASVPRLLQPETVPRQTLRISAGRAAAAAGIHPYTDIGDLFLDFVYQDLPDLLLHDAESVGVQIVSPLLERARLLAQSGQAKKLEDAIRSSASAQGLEGVREAKRVVAETIEVAQREGKLTAEEAAELRNTLELECNLEFGERHEDAAIREYETRVGSPVYGQQRRVSMGLPEAGAAEALAHCFKMVQRKVLPPLPPEEKEKPPMPAESALAPFPHGSGTGSKESDDGAYFRLTGFVDGLVDLPWGDGVLETVVVEVKHRMGSIKDPPNIYDIVQLGSYCRFFGLARGHLVQCLREGIGPWATSPVGRLDVTELLYDEGAEHRRGWDDHILPGLYKAAAAVYAARSCRDTRLRLLAAEDPGKRAQLVGELCPHLGR